MTEKAVPQTFSLLECISMTELTQGANSEIVFHPFLKLQIVFLALGFSFEKRELEYLYSLLMQFMFFFLCNMFLFAILWSARDPGDESGGKIEKM